jgi:ribosomal protein L35
VVAELSKRFHVLVSGYGIRQRHGRRHVNGKSK